MSKKIYLFSLVLLALTFTACSETEEAGRYDNWQAQMCIRDRVSWILFI